MTRTGAWLGRIRRGAAGNVRFALMSIRDHKLRSGLTVLGIVVGVTTVIAMVSIVQGFNNNVIHNLQSFGANRIEVQKHEDSFGPGSSSSEEERGRRNLTVADAQAIRERIPEVMAVASLCGYFDAEVHVKNGSLEANLPYVLGTDADYLPATAYDIGLGRFFTPSEVERSALIAVLGADVKDAIFPHEDPLGKDVTVNGLRYRVIGILARKGEQFGFSPDNKVVLPLGAFEKQFGYRVREDGVNLSVVPHRPEDVPIVVEKVIELMRERRRVPFDKPNDFAISTPDQLIRQFRAITGGVTGAMLFVAFISLLIGGVGVMNIMLVSVTQRTREIGVRRAVGAHRRDIVGQFLVEAMTLSSLGGIVGVVLGFAIAMAVRLWVSVLPAAVPTWSLVAGLGVSMAVGIVFGAWPAVKASRLDPIESLRYE